MSAKKTGRILLLLTFAAVLCACSEKQRTASAPEAVLESNNLPERLERLVPEGWAVYDQVGVFSADNLYERINGRAELYLAYDVVNLTIATFEDKTDIARFVELSVFDMGDPTSAFGIFSVERFQGEPQLDLGRMSYRSDANIYIWKGRYYITVVASDTTDEFQHLSMDMARQVTAFLTDSGEQVWGLSALPQENLISDSVRYFKVDAFGLDFMRNVYTAEYKLEGTLIKAFLSKQTGPEAARELVERFAENSRAYGRGYIRIKRNDIEYVLCDMGGTFDVISQKNELILGVTSVEDRETAIKKASDLWDSASELDGVRK
jgi:hypothetical protein